MGSVGVEEGEVDGYAAVTLRSATTSLTLLPGLGLLGTSLVVDGGEHLDLHGGVAGYAAGHTTGLPLLAPWANRLGADRYEAAGVVVDLTDAPGLHRDPSGLPIHGTLTAQPGWVVVGSGSTPQGRAWCTARFDVGARDDLLPSFPFPHLLEVRAEVGDAEILLSTTVRPTGEVPVPVSFGWHPYFTLPGVDRAGLTVRLPAAEHLGLDARMLPDGTATEVDAARHRLGDGDAALAFDDAYRLGDDRTLALEGGGRRLEVELGEGYPYAQVYAPAGQAFCALEPMTAPTNALVTGDHPTVAPGDAFLAGFAVRIETA